VGNSGETTQQHHSWAKTKVRVSHDNMTECETLHESLVVEHGCLFEEWAEPSIQNILLVVDEMSD